jgi:CheY-like chemotaxis protein
MKLAGRTIFIFEDDPTHLSMLNTILSREGATVHYNRWDMATIQSMRDLMKLDLIIIDINLPDGMNGYELLRLVRQQPGLGIVPAVAITGIDPEEGIPQAKAAGFQGFISKPVHRESLGEQLATIINGGELWG